MRIQYRIPVNGKQQFYPITMMVKAVVVHNLSGDYVDVANGYDPVTRIPPGLTQTINYDSNATQLTVGTESNTTGEAWIEVYDSPQPVNQNPAAQQAPGTINANVVNATLPVAGNVNANITNATLNATVAGSVNATITNASLPVTGTVSATITNASLTVAGSINATILNAILAVGDATTQNNTSIITGLLPQNTVAFTLTSGQSNTRAIAAASAGFGLTSTITGAGRLNVYITSSGQTVYLVRDRGFYASPLTRNPIEKRFAVPMVAGSTLTVQWDDATTAAAFVLRY